MKKHVIITGGQLANKGAQAMTFITVDEIAKRFPQYDVVLLSDRDTNRDPEELKNYKFMITSEPNFGMREYALSLFSILRKHEMKKSEQILDFVSLLNNTAALIDISGYALGSDWGDFVAIQYCLRILFAKDCNVPVYLMPQSFGPFLFRGIYGRLAKKYIQKALRYPQYVMAREKQGEDLLKTIFKLKNLIKTDDLVLQNKGINLKNIYHVVPKFAQIAIRADSIAIIPNTQNKKHGKETEIMDLYKEVIDYCIGNGRNVYLLYHSSEDKGICEKIKDLYQSSDKVIFLRDELSCIEFDSLVCKFDYIIASRFHSVVHSYRNGIPAIILGWALKYYELAKSVNQESYVINVREKMDFSGIIKTVMRMDNSYQNESMRIKKEIKSIQEKNVFDYLEL